jgi:hypothetical protein
LVTGPIHSAVTTLVSPGGITGVLAVPRCCWREIAAILEEGGTLIPKSAYRDDDAK